MIANRLRAVALSAAFTLLSFGAFAKAAPYDGSWRMVLQTTSGHCGVINIGMAFSGGHISATSSKFVMHKIARPGNGTGPSGVCSGVWTAVRA
jgi:hypothetical protein